MKRHPESIPVPGLLIVRPDAPIYYANALTVQKQIKAMVEETMPPPWAILLDAAGQDDLDITSVEVLKSMLAEMKEKGIDYYVAELHLTVREFGERTGLFLIDP